MQKNSRSKQAILLDEKSSKNTKGLAVVLSKPGKSKPNDRTSKESVKTTKNRSDSATGNSKRVEEPVKAKTGSNSRSKSNAVQQQPEPENRSNRGSKQSKKIANEVMSQATLEEPAGHRKPTRSKSKASKEEVVEIKQEGKNSKRVVQSMVEETQKPVVHKSRKGKSLEIMIDLPDEDVARPKTKSKLAQITQTKKDSKSSAKANQEAVSRSVSPPQSKRGSKQPNAEAAKKLDEEKPKSNREAKTLECEKSRGHSKASQKQGETTAEGDKRKSKGKVAETAPPVEVKPAEVKQGADRSSQTANPPPIQPEPEAAPAPKAKPPKRSKKASEQTRQSAKEDSWTEADDRLLREFVVLMPNYGSVQVDIFLGNKTYEQFREAYHGRPWSAAGVESVGRPHNELDANSMTIMHPRLQQTFAAKAGMESEKQTSTVKVPDSRD